MPVPARRSSQTKVTSQVYKSGAESTTEGKSRTGRKGECQAACANWLCKEKDNEERLVELSEL
jgi:hypothetical protein